MMGNKREGNSLGGDSFSLESVDAQMISLMRLILALSALIIISLQVKMAHWIDIGCYLVLVALSS